MNNWKIINSFRFDPSKNHAFADIINNLLKNRKITGKKAVREFLNPDLKYITLQGLGVEKKDLEKAKVRIIKAIKNKEKIVVYTDYDVDGVVSGAIIFETLYDLKADIMPFVPNRLEEGYGLSKNGLDKVKKELNPTLIITVDHGISARKEVDYARKMGIDIIIIDHHLKPENLPKAFAIIHTTRLAASGLSWIFANYLKNKKIPSFLDLVALGTVADLVPLINENRVLVKTGLEVLNKSGRIGLNSLIKSTALIKGNIDCYSLSHILAPRINASGRISSALDSLRLLCTRDPDRADMLAEKLNNFNRDRQTMTRDSTKLALSLVKENEKLTFVAHETFHQGVIGLIAGKLVDSCHRPSVVVSIGKELCKASARSVKGINIINILREVSDLLLNVGGHPMAAGFTVKKSNLQKLKIKLKSVSDTLISTSHLSLPKKIDMELDPGYIDDRLYSEIERLAPFGQANPQPIFAAYKVRITGLTFVGREKNHLKLTLETGQVPQKIISAIFFNFDNNNLSVRLGLIIDIIYQIQQDNWNGRRNLILKLKDARLSA